jgi:hypothetical protein
MDKSVRLDNGEQDASAAMNGLLFLEAMIWQIGVF